MAKSVVSIVKGTNLTEMVEEALSLLGGLSSMGVTPKSKVYLKPNAGHEWGPETLNCTTPDMAEACIKAFQKAKPKEIFLCEAGALSMNTDRCWEGTGMAKPARELGVKCVDLKSEMSWRPVIVPGEDTLSPLLLPSILLDPDAFLVDVPRMKLWGGSVISGVIKNMRPVQDYVHREMHFKDLNKSMAQLIAACRPQLSIAEITTLSDGRKTVNVGVVVAGRDPVAVDATSMRILGLPVEAATHVHMAAKLGVGTTDEKEIEVKGKSIKEVFTQIDAPLIRLMKQGIPDYPGYKIYAETACIACALSAEGIVQGFQRNPAEYEKNKGMTIVVGPRKALPEGVGMGSSKDKNLILIGNCVAKFRNRGVFVAGCGTRGTPPRIALMTRTDQGDLEYFWKPIEREDVGENFTGWKGYKKE